MLKFHCRGLSLGLSLLLACSTMAFAQRSRGPVWGGRGNEDNNSSDADAAQIQSKIAHLLGDGYAALKVCDNAAAWDDFSDVLQIQSDQPHALLGIALCHAQIALFQANGEFTTAYNAANRTLTKIKNDLKATTTPSTPTKASIDFQATLKSDMRLANYNLAVIQSRINQKVRALVLINQLLIDAKPVDELLVNAQRVLLDDFDDKARSAIAAMPAFVKTLDSANTALVAQHSPLQRWGIDWVSAEQISRHNAAGEKEQLPKDLPFLLPGDVVMPELGKKFAVGAVNPLVPIVASNTALASKDPAKPANPKPVKPKPVDPMPDIKPVDPAPPIVKPAITKPAVAPAPAIAVHAVRGAAFAVAPDLLLTCSRLVAGAKSIDIESTDGVSFHAKLVAADDVAGLALIKVEGGHFSPLSLSPQIRAGAVQVVAFPRPGIFAPSLDILPGQLTAADNQFFLHTSAHPRSAGSPVLDDTGRVVALVTATRDDPINHLPVVSVEALRKFAAGKFTFVEAESHTNPNQCVLELSATRDGQ